ncbi:MAG: DUF58 domain-containing protein [Planctomycetota bacterium]|jgi:uncharacterized protein (DUF58 family)|nr:MAG: DUF58 domain-containing protein [Planctomycetota bacterium]RLS95498.1 MAG: DUF58 domain-containing protein [Planctomycetota bacterium]
MEVRPLRKLDELLDSKLMAKLDAIDVMSRKIFSGKLQGERRSKRRGQSVEFADFRPYSHGDDLRFVDWNIYGRLDRLFLKMFLEEEDLSLVIAIDTSASMRAGNPDAFDYARRVAMALAYVGLVNQHRVSLVGFSQGRIERATNIRGRRKASDVAQWLLKLEPSGVSGFEEAMRVIGTSRSGRGVMVMLSDFLFPEGFEKGLAMVAGRGFDMFALQILAPQVADPSREGGITGDVLLVDSETGLETEVTVTPELLRLYRDRLDRLCGALRGYCTRRDIVHMVVESSTPVETLMLEYLRRRGLLR